MGIFSDRRRGLQQWRGFEPQCEHVNSDSSTKHRNQWRHGIGKRNIFSRCIGLLQSKQLHNDNSRCSVSIYPELSRTRDDQPNSYTKSNHNRVGHRYNKRVYAVVATVLGLNSFILPMRVNAEGVGGVSATANPIANSSGSVTNQAIQVLQGPYVTNTYGGGVSCQGTTLNMTPYVQFADSRKDPWEDYFNEPQYNVTDTSGKMVPTYVTVKNYPWETWYDNRTKDDGTRWFEDGADITIIQDIDSANGVPDIVDTGGSMTPSWYKPVRTDMRANQSFNLGLSATLSIPLNRGMQKKCSEAATAQVAAVNQATANKRLDFEIARLKNCGELLKAGIMFHPKSPYASICADVVVTNPGGSIKPHTHEFPQPTFNDPSSSKEVDPSSLGTSQSVSQSNSGDVLPSSQASSELSQSPSSLQVSQPSGANLLGVWQIGQTQLPQ